MYVRKYKNMEELKEYVIKAIDRDIKENPVVQYDSNMDLNSLNAGEIVQKLFSEIKEGDNDVLVKKMNERFDVCEEIEDIWGRAAEAILEFKEEYEKVMPYFVYFKKLREDTYQWTVVCVLANKQEKENYWFCGWSV